MEAIANSTLHTNVTNLSGVPPGCWCSSKHILEKTGKQSLEEVWPNLEVFFHGGVAFTPYREQYKQIIKSSKMHYVETYNASEGYFGTQNDPNDPAMLLMMTTASSMNSFLWKMSARRIRASVVWKR